MSDPVSSPSVFVASIGGYMGRSYSVEKMGNGLEYRRYDSGFELRQVRLIHPGEEDWVAFRQALDEIGVWEWRSDYTDPGILDGTNWGLEIRWGDRAISTGGSNGYPGGSYRSRTFTAFLEAVSKLVGGRPFS